MKIDGRQIASGILEDLKSKVEDLKKKNVIPHLYIITFGENAQTESYLKQKLLRASQIGAKITIKRFAENVSTVKVYKLIENLNSDKNVNGIIVQRPLLKTIDEEKIALSINPDKDVDGFHPHSKFFVPVAIAVLKLLEIVHPQNFNDWLKSKKIAVIGKGITAGKPIANSLHKLGVQPLIMDSKTDNRDKILKKCDIIISAVGKQNIVSDSDIKKGVILIGVGLSLGKDGKFHGDYNEEKIKNVASYYTPTPGGVGPVNVAMLFGNLVEASEKQAS